MDKRRPPQSDSRRRSVPPSGSRPVSRSGAPSGRRPVSPPARRAAPSKKMPLRQADPRSGQIQAVQQRRKRKRKRNYTLYYILLFFILKDLIGKVSCYVYQPGLPWYFQQRKIHLITIINNLLRH